ncbi:MAG: YjbH domain-containing protein [Roseovarius sp.]|nr:YjbH domain-containing protein [Roseovarius sp.]
MAGETAPRIETGYNSYGYPGMIDMPVAHSRPDGELAFSISDFAGQTRNTLTFQLLPRLSGSFRYTRLENFPLSGGTVTNYDRSFSVHFRFADETWWRPAMAVGLNDFLGTGIYSSEYLVATKTIGERVRVTGGLGWGRLGTSGGFRNPLSVFGDKLETRPARDTGRGGKVASQQFFRGDAAFFGGIEWQATDRLRFTAEYSSDAYPREEPTAFERDSQINLGVTYGIGPMTDISLRWLYGSEIGVQLSTALNPKNPPNHGGREPAPPPVLVRGMAPGAALSWGGHLAQEQGSDDADHADRRLAAALAGQGVRLHGLALSDDRARVEIENLAWPQEAQAVGRTARVLSRELPPGIEHFEIVLVSSGMPVTTLVIARSDMETLEHDLDGAWKSFARARLSSPAGPVAPLDTRYPGFEWGLKPYLLTSLFDPDDPVRADLGAELRVLFEAAPGLEFGGALRKRVIGNLDESTRQSNSVLPRVRSEFNIYDREGDPTIPDLTAAYYFKPGENLYGRLTAGYLERMFGGVSGELLWKRTESPFALGIEVNHVQQRDFDQLFGFQDYSVTTGHVSAYLELGGGFHAQVDAGRYLARDWGATFALDREFGNGWRVGAFATFTDVSEDDFGEGSFDKGIRITIPLSWIVGEPNKTRYSTTIRPLLRDGGARLDVGGRLYERVRPLHKPALQRGWGRFWR